MSAAVTHGLQVELTKAQLEELADLVAARMRAKDTVDQDHLPVGLTRRVYMDAARAGSFPTRKVGRMVVTTRGELEAWIAQRPSATSEKRPKKAPDGAQASEEDELRAVARRNHARVR